MHLCLSGAPERVHFQAKITGSQVMLQANLDVAVDQASQKGQNLGFFQSNQGDNFL